MAVETLTVDDVKRVHSRLVVDFAESDDPIAPPGVRSEDLLASAVSRQHVGRDKTGSSRRPPRRAWENSPGSEPVPELNHKVALPAVRRPYTRSVLV